MLLIEQLQLTSRDFGWLFVPSIAGMMTGAAISSRVASRLTPVQTITLGYGLMAVAAAVNLAIFWSMPPSLPWTIVPLPIYACGMSIVMPSATILILDLFPATRGLASSLQGFTHTMLSGIVAGAVAPVIHYSTRALAGAMFGFAAMGFIYWMLYRRSLPQRSPGI